jgi:peptidoglycan/LPS O-acetylase OafA/YrhL
LKWFVSVELGGEFQFFGDQQLNIILTKTDQVLAPNLSRRIPCLDGLRGFAVLVVLLGHVSASNGAPDFLNFGYIHSLGNVGVRIFFVLSGFLITTLLLREWDATQSISLKNFYIRRIRRIVPAFAAYVIIIWSLYLWGFIELRYHLYSGTLVESAIPDLIRAVTFTANFHHDYNWYFNHLWSLSVEEQFYLLWPLALVVRGPKRGLYLALVVIFLVPFIRWYMYMNLDGNYVAVSREFQAVCDALLTGAVSAMTYNAVSTNKQLRQTLESFVGLVVGVLFLAIGYASVVIRPDFSYIVGQSFSNIGLAIIIQHLVRRPDGLAGRFVSNKVFVYFGLISYSLYLWQQPFTYFKLTSFESSYPQNILFSIVAACLSYYLIERKFTGGEARK